METFKSCLTVALAEKKSVPSLTGLGGAVDSLSVSGAPRPSNVCLTSEGSVRLPSQRMAIDSSNCFSHFCFFLSLFSQTGLISIDFQLLFENPILKFVELCLRLCVCLCVSARAPPSMCVCV
jgi:hypothetical protein